MNMLMCIFVGQICFENFFDNILTTLGADQVEKV